MTRFGGWPGQVAPLLSLSAIMAELRFGVLTFGMFRTVAQDLHFAARAMRKRPGPPVVIMLTLALGVGATSTMFSVFNALVLRPLPFPDAGRLVMIWETYALGGQRLPKTSTFREWQRHARTLESPAAAERWAHSRTIYFADRSAWLRTQVVGPEALPTLGTRPLLGRIPNAEVSHDGDLAVVSERFWRTRLAADSAIARHTLRSGDHGPELSVVAVMPEGFFVLPWANDVDVWIVSEIASVSEDHRWGLVLGRLRPGFGIDQAQTEMRAIGRGRTPPDPQPGSGWGITVEPYHRFADASKPQLIFWLFGAAGLVLLIACANIASMLLARSVARDHEIGTRAALGATPGRLARQLLTESVLLGLLGGALGLCVALGGVELFKTVASRLYPRADEIGIDWVVLGFGIAVSSVAGLLFGLAPAVSRRRRSVVQSLRQTPRRVTASASPALGSLVTAQVGLAFALLVGTGLMIRSTLSLMSMDMGFRSEGLVTFEVTLEDAEFVSNAEVPGTTRPTTRASELYRRILQRANALPGIDGVAMASRLPPGWILRRPVVAVDGLEVGAEVRTTYAQVNEEFFTTLEIPLLRGRVFEPWDGPASGPVAIINSTLARLLFADDDPIGRLIQVDLGLPPAAAADPPRVIVGVVGDIRQDLRLTPEPSVYVSYRQSPAALPGSGDLHLHQQFALRSASVELSAVRTLLDQLSAELGGGWTYYNLGTMRSRFVRSLAEDRLFTRVIGMFGLVAIFLATIGLYGTISYAVSRRTNEIGVRMALGAHPRAVLGLVIGGGVRIGLAGVGLGALASLALSRLLSARLFGVTPTDPATFGVVAILLLGVAALASYVPARRAARVDPLTALRAE